MSQFVGHCKKHAIPSIKYCAKTWRVHFARVYANRSRFRASNCACWMHVLWLACSRAFRCRRAASRSHHCRCCRRIIRPAIEPRRPADCGEGPVFSNSGRRKEVLEGQGRDFRLHHDRGAISRRFRRLQGIQPHDLYKWPAANRQRLRLRNSAWTLDFDLN